VVGARLAVPARAGGRMMKKDGDLVAGLFVPIARDQRQSGGHHPGHSGYYGDASRNRQPDLIYPPSAGTVGRQSCSRSIGQSISDFGLKAVCHIDPEVKDVQIHRRHNRHHILDRLARCHRAFRFDLLIFRKPSRFQACPLRDRLPPQKSADHETRRPARPVQAASLRRAA